MDLMVTNHRSSSVFRDHVTYIYRHVITPILKACLDIHFSFELCGYEQETQNVNNFLNYVNSVTKEHASLWKLLL